MGRIAEANRDDKITIQALRPHHRAMARYVAAGKRPIEIAEIFGLSLPQISVICNSPLFQTEVDRLCEGMELDMKDAATELKELTGRATEVLAEELYSPEKGSTLRARVAFEVLQGTAMLRKGGEQHFGDKTINIINYTPEPGDDPIEIETKLVGLRKGPDNGPKEED
jgi:hypothetical protein